MFAFIFVEPLIVVHFLLWMDPHLIHIIVQRQDHQNDQLLYSCYCIIFCCTILCYNISSCTLSCCIILCRIILCLFLYFLPLSIETRLKYPKLFHNHAFLLTNSHHITFFVILSLTQLVKFFNSFCSTIILGIIQSLCYSLSCFLFKQVELLRVDRFRTVLYMRACKSITCYLFYS